MLEQAEELISAMQEDMSEMEGKYLTFWTDKQLFGIPIADVVQIVQIQDITAIPEFPAFAKGIINSRGSMIPVIDMRLRLGKQEAPYDEHTCTIITIIEGKQVGCIVDGVDEVTTIESEEISPPPTLSGGASSEFLTGIGRAEGKIILLLDIHRFLGEVSFY